MVRSLGSALELNVNDIVPDACPAVFTAVRYSRQRDLGGRPSEFVTCLGSVNRRQPSGDVVD